MIINLSGSSNGGGGGDSGRYIETNGIYQSHSYITLDASGIYYPETVKTEATPGDTIYIRSTGSWILDEIRREDTGDLVTFTTIYEHTSNGSLYSFTMPDANVTYDLNYDD